MPRYFVSDLAMQSTFAKVEGSRVWAWIEGPGLPEWDEQPPGTSVAGMKPFYDGDETGFKAKYNADVARRQHEAGRDVF